MAPPFTCWRARMTSSTCSIWWSPMVRSMKKHKICTWQPMTATASVTWWSVWRRHWTRKTIPKLSACTVRWLMVPCALGCGTMAVLSSASPSGIQLAYLRWARPASYSLLLEWTRQCSGSRRVSMAQPLTPPMDPMTVTGPSLSSNPWRHQMVTLMTGVSIRQTLQ